MDVYTTIFFEFIIVLSAILVLFKFRNKLGLAPLYILLGAIQFILANLSSSFNLKIFEHFVVYPGSIILFSGVLFAVLLIYIKEGVSSARALIIGIVITNIFIAIMFEITYLQQTLANELNGTLVNTVFKLNLKYYLSGTAILLLDVLLLVIIYQFLVIKFKKLPYFFILFFSLLSILVFDALAFNLVLFLGTPIFETALVSHLLGKSISALLYATILYVYLKYFDFEKVKASLIASNERDVLSILKYKKRYEDLKKEKKRVEQQLTSQLETSLHNISDGFISLDTNWRYTFINKKAAQFLGKTTKSLLGKNIWAVFPEGVGSNIYNKYHEALQTQKTMYFEDYYEKLDKWFENRVYPSKEGLTIYFTDITEQKKAELALKESENHIKTILKTEPECIKQLNAEGELIYMNPAGLEMIEADSFEMVKGKSVLSLIAPDYQEAFKQHIEDVFKGQSRKLVFELTGYKGRKRWLETHAVPFKDTEGNIISLLAVTRDISEQKKAEENLINSEKLFRRLASNAPVGIFQTDKEGSCNYVNEEWLVCADMSFQDAMGFGWSNAIHPEDRDQVVQQWQNYVLHGGEFDIEFRFKNNKQTKWVSVKAVRLYDVNNNLSGYIGMTLDITGRKEAEEQIKNSEKYLENIINNIGDPVFVKDENSVFLTANTEFYRLFNRTKEQIIGKDFADDVSQEERARYLSIDKKVLKEGQENVYEDMIDVNGEIRFISTKKTRFIDQNGKKHLIGVIRDITELKNAEKQILESKEYLNNILNNIGDPVFVKDEQSRVLLVNNAFCEIFNLSREEVIGKTLAENVSPEEREIFLSVDKEVLSTGIENVNEETLTIKGKETRIISTKKTRFIDRDGHKFIIGTIRDNTERKKAEKEILALGNRNTKIIESLHDGFLLADSEGKILDVNPSYLRMIGYSKEELLTMNINAIEAVLNPAEIEERINEMIAVGYARFNSKHKKKNGEIIDLDVNTFIMKVNDVQVVAAFMKDITDRIKAEKELELYRNNLEELVEKRTEEVRLKNAELERMNKLFVGRELRMKELKKIIKDLQKKNDD